MHRQTKMAVALGLLSIGCAGGPTPAPEDTSTQASAPAEARSFSMTRARAALNTRVFLDASPLAPDRPPPELFELVRYPAELGDNLAYVTPVRAGEPGPGIVWIHGGFDWGIDAYAWQPAPRENDQSARAFREAGVAMIHPALRGSNGNPGRNECMAGEVDDVIAAGRYLASRPDVDPARVYLGGHSTGGTIALLTAQSTELFAGVFAFGPIDDVANYGECPLPAGGGLERTLRQPTAYLSEIVSPTYVIEGGAGGNIDAFPPLEAARGSAPVRLIHVPLADHFSVLAPGTEVIARALLEGRDLTQPDAINMPEFVAALVDEGADWKLPTMTAVRLVRVQGLVEVIQSSMHHEAVKACQDGGGTDCARPEGFVPPLSGASLEAEAALVLCQVYSPAQIAAAERFFSSPTARLVTEAKLRALRDPSDPAGQTPQLSRAQEAEFEDFVSSEHGSEYMGRFDQVIELLIERAAAMIE